MSLQSTIAAKFGTRTIAAAAVVLVWASFASVRPAVAQDVAEIRVREYLPLAATTKWEYDAVFALPLFAPRRATATAEIEGKTTIEGREYYKLVTTVKGAPVTQITTVYYRVTPEAIYQRFERNAKIEDAVLLPDPLTIGQKWTFETPDGKVSAHAEKLEDVQCGDTVYKDCIRLTTRQKVTFGEVVKIEWLAPGVGMVKRMERSPVVDIDTELSRHVKQDSL